MYAALATPRCPNGVEADAAALFDYLDTIIAAGVNGVVLFGSTGEFVHFDLTERIRVLMLAVKRCRLPLLVNVSHSTLTGAIELAEDAVEAGVAGVLLMPPYFYRYNEGQIYEFYRQFATALAGKTQIYLYNIPLFTNPMPAALIEELLATGTFAGIKDSSGDLQLLDSLLALRANSSFQLFVGSDRLYSRALQGGADGIVSGVAAAMPELLVALDYALRSDDQPRVQALQSRLEQFLSWVDKFPAAIAIKLAAMARGWKFNHFAIPFDGRTTADREAFEHWFREWLPAALAEANSTAAVRT